MFLGHFERGFWPPLLHHHHLGLQGAVEGGSKEQIQGERRSAIEENIKELAGADPTSLHHHILVGISRGFLCFSSCFIVSRGFSCIHVELDSQGHRASGEPWDELACMDAWHTFTAFGLVCGLSFVFFDVLVCMRTLYVNF